MSITRDYDKVLTRLTQIVQRLQAGDVLHVPALAEAFGVSRKTIQRDLHERLVNYPIVADGHGWRLMPDAVVASTPSELLVKETLAQLASAIGGEFERHTKRLLSQTGSVDTPNLSTHLQFQDPTAIGSLMSALEAAIAQRNEVRFLYKNKWRRVQPYRLVNFDGYWYLYGLEPDSQRLKTWYLADMQQLTATQLVFMVQADAIDKLRYAMNVWFEPSNSPFEVVLVASQEIARYFYRRPMSQTQQVLQSYDDGSIHIQLMVTSENEVLHEVKKWQPHLCVLSPQSLATKALAQAQAFVAQQLGYLD